MPGFSRRDKMLNKTLLAVSCALLIAVGGCSRQQSDWEKTREANTADAYQQFLKKYPSGEFTAQAESRLKELSEEGDWQKARDADTPEAYQAFLKQYPDGKWSEEARIRIENFTLAQTPAGSAGGPPSETAPAASAASGSAPGAPGTAPAEAGKASTEPEGAAATAPAPPHAKHERHAASAAASPSAEPHEKGKYAVQLGAFKSGKAAAERRWARLRKENPRLLTGLSSRVVARKTAGGTLYRLQAVGLSEARAERICKSLKARSQPCVIVRPAHAAKHAPQHAAHGHSTSAH